MRNKLPVILGLFLGVFCGIGVKDAAGQTASMPVMSIDALGGNKAQIPCWQPAVGQGISEMLIESLESSDIHFQVLETSDEPNSSASASTGGDTETAPGGSGGSKNSARGNSAGSKKTAGSEQPDTGNTAAAANSVQPAASSSPDSDFTFCGDVTEFTMQTNSSRIGDFVSSSPFANLGGKVITARVEIVWRIVDTATKRVIKRGMTVCSASGSQFNMSALASPSANAQTAGSGSTTATAKAAVAKKTGNTNKSPNNNNNLALANNFFNGFNKAFGNAPAEGSSDDSADSSNVNGGKKAPSAKTAAPTKPTSEGGGGSSAGDSAIIGYGDPEFMSSALGKATCKAVTNIIEQLAAINLPEPARVAQSKAASDALKHTSGKVLAVVGNTTLVVSLGSKEGFKEGDQLELYQTNDVKDDKGNVVFTDEKQVGEITLSEVQDEKSLGSYSGGTPAQQGWTVKAR